MVTYNGWTNYPTWNVKLWLDNDESTQTQVETMARGFAYATHPVLALGDNLKAMIQDSQPAGASMYNDILGWALEQVNWREIAESYLEELEEFVTV